MPTTNFSGLVQLLGKQVKTFTKAIILSLLQKEVVTLTNALMNIKDPMPFLKLRTKISKTMFCNWTLYPFWPQACIAMDKSTCRLMVMLTMLTQKIGRKSMI